MFDLLDDLIGFRWTRLRLLALAFVAASGVALATNHVFLFSLLHIAGLATVIRDNKRQTLRRLQQKERARR